MGRRSKKRYKRIQPRVRRLPTRFQCPACGLMTLGIEMKREEGVAIISCSNSGCGLRATINNVPRIYQEVDVYAKFLDRFADGSIEVSYVKGGNEDEMEG